MRGRPARWGSSSPTRGRRARRTRSRSRSTTARLPVPLETLQGAGERAVDQEGPHRPRRLLTRSMGHLVLPDGLLDQLGPAVGSGRSVLLYGPPGNGKSSIAEGIRAALGDNIWIPHAIEYAGQVITLYDPIVHTRVVAARDAELAAQGERPRRRALHPVPSPDGHDRRRALAVDAGPELQRRRADLSGLAAAEVVRGRVHRRRPRPAGGAAAEAREPLDRADGDGLRHPRAAIGREVRGAVRHAGRVLDQLPSEPDLRHGRAAPHLLQGADRRADAASSSSRSSRWSRRRRGSSSTRGRCCISCRSATRRSTTSTPTSTACS